MQLTTRGRYAVTAMLDLALLIDADNDNLRIINPEKNHYFAAGVVPAIVSDEEGSKLTLGNNSGYTYLDLGGVVVTVDQNILQVLAHEIGHNFGLGDEYCSAPDPYSCSGSDNNPPPKNLLGGRPSW